MNRDELLLLPVSVSKPFMVNRRVNGHFKIFIMEFLQQLNLKPDNNGTSTGSKTFANPAEKIKSCSKTLDGKLIGNYYPGDFRKTNNNKTIEICQVSFY